MVKSVVQRVLRKWMLFARIFLVALLCLLTASAAFHGFYSKWGMREDAKSFGLQSMLDDTAVRPWAYRQLMPAVSNAIDKGLPPSIHEKMTARMLSNANGLHYDLEVKAGPVLARQPAYTLRYYLVYYMAFASLLLAMPLMIAFSRTQGISFPAALFGAVFFVLTLPFLETVGGYYYDLGEVFFMFAYAVLLTNKKWRFLCVPLAIVATMNKESFLAFIVTTGPLCVALTTLDDLRNPRRLLSDRMGIAITVVAAIASFVTHAAMMPALSDHPGSETQRWLFQNIAFYLDPRSLFHFETTYGLQLFAGYHLVTLLLFGLIVAYGLPRLPSRTRVYAAWAAAINFTLLLLFAFPGEMRNLSFLYPPAVLCLAATIERLWMQPTLAPQSQW